MTYTQSGEAGQFQIVLNCTNFTLPQLKTINLTESACGMACLLISLIILGVLLAQVLQSIQDHLAAIVSVFDGYYNTTGGRFGRYS